MSKKKKGFFSRGDRKPSRLSDFTVDDEPADNYWPSQTPTVPTGVVEVHESVQLPTKTSHTGNNHHNGQFHLPPIGESNHHSHGHAQAPHDHHHANHSSPLAHGHEHSHHNHHHSNHAPLPAVDNQHFEHSSGHHHSNHHEHQHSDHHHADHYGHQQSEHHHGHQPSEHHHGHQPSDHHHSAPHGHQPQQRHGHGHKHRVLETFDPRWWYLPAGTVHTPKAWRTPQYHHVPGKWYEPPRSYYKMLKKPEEHRLPPRLHIDCRCLVCRPPREKIRGVKWVTNP